MFFNTLRSADTVQICGVKPSWHSSLWASKTGRRPYATATWPVSQNRFDPNHKLSLLHGAWLPVTCCCRSGQTRMQADSLHRSHMSPKASFFSVQPLTCCPQCRQMHTQHGTDLMAFTCITIASSVDIESLRLDDASDLRRALQISTRARSFRMWWKARALIPSCDIAARSPAGLMEGRRRQALVLARSLFALPQCTAHYWPSRARFMQAKAVSRKASCMSSLNRT